MSGNDSSRTGGSPECAFLAGGGEAGERMRAFDWTTSPLGCPAVWPEALKVLVSVVLTSTQPMFLVWGPDRIFLYNDAFIPIAGRKHPTSFGLASRVVWAEAWTEIGALFDRVFEGEPMYMTGFKVGLDRRGRVEDAYFDFSYTPVRTENEGVRGLFGVCIETTERVAHARQQLQNVERERDRIFEMSRDLFAVATFDGHLKSINPAWSRQLCRSDDELLSKPFSLIIHPDDLGETADVIAKLQQGKPVHQFLVRLLKSDGTPISFAWSAMPESADAGIFYTVGRDITEDQRREEALRQSQKMEAVGQLTGGLAHDFNNLLQAVHGNLDLIRRRPEDPARVSRLAENGIQAAERGAKLTAQLLAFSRAQKLELRTTAIAPLIAGMDDILKSSLGPRVRVRVDTEGSGLGVIADPTQLEMAILNLATNARDAMPDGGDLTIEMRQNNLMKDPELPPGNYVEIRISDTGHGMSPAVVAKAFDPFFTTKGPGKGTGLGLSQVYGMARQAGGIARIESREPLGTTIVLLLKFVQLSFEAGSEMVDSPMRANKALTVLAVDDDADVRRFLEDSLESLGFQVMLAEDGERGLSALETFSPDVLLLDFAMPDMSGAEVADRVRALQPDLPIIFASGYSDTAAIERAAGSSAVLLRKPFRIDDLEAALRAAVAKARDPVLRLG
jgi:PAS domain S-box-containing protein